MNATDNTPATIWTANTIKEAVRATGSHWYDPDTMRFWGTKVLPEVYQGPGGIFFLTVDDRFDRTRGLTLREFIPPPAERPTIQTRSDVAQYQYKNEAMKAARDASGIIVPTATEKFQPVNNLQQFVDDCRTHGDSLATRGVTTKHAKSLILQSAEHARQMVRYCNGEISLDAEGELPRFVQGLRARITRLAHQLGAASVEFQGDPRGATVKIHWPDHASNAFAGGGWIIPESLNDAD